MSFILEDLSRWYIQLVRPRMWLEEEVEEKEQSYQCLYYVLRKLTLLLAPFAPHITEKMYHNLRLPGDPASVHLQDWMGPDERLVDPDLEKMMDVVRLFDDATAAARQAGKRKLRWPVAECIVSTASPEVRGAIVHLNRLCTTRANSRSVSVAGTPWDKLQWKAGAVMKEIGPVFGRDGPKVKALIEATEGSTLRQLLETQGKAVLKDNGCEFEITPAQVTFTEEVPDGFFSAPMKDATVYVNCQLTPELEGEGYAREIIRRLQEMRRQRDLRVEDFIAADVVIHDDRICSLITTNWSEAISKEVRANHLAIRRIGDPTPNRVWELQTEWDIDGVMVQTAISCLADT